MTHAQILKTDGRLVAVAVDHPLYSWPNDGLLDRDTLIRQVVAAGADALIASYGTIRDCRDAFGGATTILKLDTTILSVGQYQEAEYRIAWTVEDALRLGASAVLTFAQLGGPGELDALVTAGRVAAAADAAGIAYVCEILPVEGRRFPDPFAPDAIAAAARVGAELGAHIVKTSMPTPPEATELAATCGKPLLIAGGEIVSDRQQLLEDVRTAIAGGAAGVAFGRNVWGTADAAGMVRALRALVHSDDASRRGAVPVARAEGNPSS